MATGMAGFQCTLAKNTGTITTPVWAEQEEIGDVNLSDFTRSAIELSRRANKFTKTIPGLINSIKISATYYPTMDPAKHTGLVTDMLAGTASEWLFLNGPLETVGTCGLRMPAIVTSANGSQPLNDNVTSEIELTLALMFDSDSEVDPAWYTVS